VSGGSAEDAVAAGRLVRALVLRTGWFLATLLGAAFLLQALLWAAPGDPIDLLPNGEELRADLEEEWGLDQPLPLRFAGFVSRGLQGDLGNSLTVRPGASVVELVKPAAARSFRLLLPALLLGMSLALVLGRLTAGRQSALRRLVEVLSVAPVFLLAYVIVIGLNDVTFHAMQSGWISRPDWFALPDQASSLRTAIAIAVLAVGSSSLTELHAATENEIVQIRESGYVEAAIARGGSPEKHEAWNLIPPLSSLASSRVTFMVGGLIILEKVLLMNGAGALLWEACLRRDYNLAMGLTLCAALVVCGARLLGDVVRVVVDPRLRSQA